MMPPKCYTWLESCGSQLSDGKNEKLFFCILQSVGFSMTLRTDIFLYTEKLSYPYYVRSVLHSEVHSWLRSRHMKKQRSTLYRKWASYGFDMRNIKIHNSYSEKIKSSYIVIEHTHCYHHTSQSQFGSFSLQGSLWHFVYVSIWHFLSL